MTSTLGVYTIKQYGIVMYRFGSKLVCLSKPVKVTDNNKKAYCVICPFSIYYICVMF